MTHRPAVVIGVGHPYRRDDAIGPTVASEIAQLHLPGVRIVISDGEPVSLLAAWEDTGLAIVVDAVRHEPPCPGRIHRLTATHLAGDVSAASSHGFGVPYALLLSRALNRQPSHLVMVGIEAADTGAGSGLSEAVAAAVPASVAAVRAELDSHLR